MPAWFSWLVRFGIEAFLALRPAVSWPGMLVKALVAAGAISAVLLLTNHVSVGITSSDGTQIWESAHLELRWVIYVGAVLALLIWALGAAWVRVFTLRMDDRVRRVVDGTSPRYQISIANLGYTDTPILVRMEEWANENGPIEEWNTQFPVVLFQAPISRGFPHNVILFTHRPLIDQSDPRALIDVSDVTTGRTVFSLGPLYFQKGNKLWFRIVISAVDQSMWFSVQRIRKEWNSELRVIREDPPHRSV